MTIQQGDKLEPVKQEVDQAVNNIDAVRQEFEDDVIAVSDRFEAAEYRLATLEGVEP